MKRAIVASFRIVVLAAVFFASALPLVAQRTDTSPTPTFRRGGEWQHGIDKAEEAEKRLRLKIDGFSHDEWVHNALAWLRYDHRDSSIMIDSSYRVADVSAGKKTEVAKQGDEEQPAWHVAYGKKPPKSLVLTLTDQGRTQVTCRFREAREAEGLWGVFQDPETTFLHCFWRAAPEPAEPLAGR